MKHTPGLWEAEHRPNSDPSLSHAVVTDSDGNELFDTLNRGYRVSLVEQLDGDGRWYDTAGYADLQIAAAAPELLSALRSTLSTLDFAIQKGVLKCHGIREAALAAIAKAEGR